MNPPTVTDEIEKAKAVAFELRQDANKLVRAAQAIETLADRLGQVTFVAQLNHDTIVERRK